MTKLFALIDCNNFYASCERVFRPDLDNKPVAVLSNNDGCVVARSAEVKAIGVPMGAPYFKVRKILADHGAAVFSSNYELYGDMSSRVMSALGTFSPDVEIYSIDEAFVGLDGFDAWNLHAHARALRQTVKRWTGIPVSIGIAPTKTLAKVAAERAKKDPRLGGVAVLKDRCAVQAALKQTPIGDVWGVGRRWSKRFLRFGVYTAWDFSQQPEYWVRKKMGVTGARTHMELKGHVCFDLDNQPQNRKTCVASRSFARPIADFDGVRSAVATFSARACERLRAGGWVAGQVMAFAHTDRFNVAAPQYQASAIVALPYPSQFTTDITRAALAALKQGFREGYRYKKAGVMLLDLSSADESQATLFTPSQADLSKAERLQQALDGLNAKSRAKHRGGRDLVRLGATGMEREGAGELHGAWHLRRDRKSPRYTTQWAELVRVR